MKRLILLAVLFSAACAAQVSGNAKKIQNKAVCATAPVDTSVLTYSSSLGCWTPSGAGAAGPTGPAGADGTDGNSVLSGAGAPTGGQDGDFWIDTTAKCLYGPKAAGTWPTSCVSMVNAGSTTDSSALVLPELGVNGVSDTRIYGADSQSVSNCIVWPATVSASGQVAADSNATAVMTDGKTCRVFTWQTPSGGTSLPWIPTLVAPAAAASWTAIGTLTKADVTGMLNVTGTGNGSAVILSVVKAIPASTFDIKIGMIYRTQTGSGNQMCGLVVTDGATTGSQHLMFGQYLNAGLYYTEVLYSADNALGSAADVYRQNTQWSTGGVLWVRAVQDATNITFYNSTDGQNWGSAIYQEAKAAHFAIADYGVGCWVNDTQNFQYELVHDSH